MTNCSVLKWDIWENLKELGSMREQKNISIGLLIITYELSFLACKMEGFKRLI